MDRKHDIFVHENITHQSSLYYVIVVRHSSIKPAYCAPRLTVFTPLSNAPVRSPFAVPPIVVHAVYRRRCVLPKDLSSPSRRFRFGQTQTKQHTHTHPAVNTVVVQPWRPSVHWPWSPYAVSRFSARRSCRPTSVTGGPAKCCTTIL